jgi:hypothetical protein
VVVPPEDPGLILSKDILLLCCGSKVPAGAFAHPERFYLTGSAFIIINGKRFLDLKDGRYNYFN